MKILIQLLVWLFNPLVFFLPILSIGKKKKPQNWEIKSNINIIRKDFFIHLNGFFVSFFFKQPWLLLKYKILIMLSISTSL